MKATLATLIVSLLVASAYAQSCDENNDRFLAALKYYSGTAITVTTGYSVIRPSPGAPFEVCDEIWSAAGSCCYVTATKAAYNDRMNNIKKSWSDFIWGASNVKNMLSRLQSMSANRETVKTDLTIANTQNPAPFEGLTPEQGTVLIEKVNEFSVQVVEFAEEANACFNELIRARGVAFCYGCSANAAHKAYFRYYDGQFTINQASRNAIAAVCIKPWGFIHALGGMMQMFATLNYQRDPRTANYPQIPVGGSAYRGVNAPQLYDAFIACPNATVRDNCTQAIIDQIVVSQFNLFQAEKYARYGNTDNYITSSLPLRLLQYTSYATGDVDIGAASSDGADLTIAFTRPPFTGTINTTSITPQAPGGSSGRSTSSGNIFLVTATAITAAVALTLN